MTEHKPQPNDKQTLLDAGGYEMYNRELLRNVFPRIINEAYDEAYAEKKRKPEIRDIVYFYFLLQSYIDGNETRADGTKNDRFGACFLGYDEIMRKMRIDRNRVRFLAKILETNGIIRAVDQWKGTRRFKWYFPSYCPLVTSDGYLVDEDGAKIEPDFDEYKLTERKRKKP
jgi:hypothetical protein